MALFPGGRKQQGGGVVDALDNDALANSMALAMEDEMKRYTKSIKNQDLPASMEHDRRLLFVAIARGVLGYLNTHQATISTHVGNQTGTVSLDVNMDHS
jgi:hypothetical protein